MIIRPFTIAAALVAACATSSAFAEEFGPYRYRYGVEQAHTQWERTVSVAGDKVIIHTCSRMVMSGKSRDRQCWTEDPRAARRNGDVLFWRDDEERFTLNFASGRLTMLNAELKFDLEAGDVPWPDTPMEQ